ncbi:MAG: hypothetical protein FGM43_11745 [Sinobacteraceae bacterium]|nr:hypothetical protein [Nevskiaceae bacterium]
MRRNNPRDRRNRACISGSAIVASRSRSSCPSGSSSGHLSSASSRSAHHKCTSSCGNAAAGTPPLAGNAQVCQCCREICTMRRTMPRTAPGVQYFGVMSFILDALKKSENSRLRQDHPAIFDAQAAAVRRQGLPRWGIALMVLLAFNLLILGYVLWRPAKPSPNATAAQPKMAAASTSNAPATAPPPAESAPSMAAQASTARRSSSSAPARAILQAAPVSATSDAASAETAANTPSRDDLLAAGAAIPEANLNMHVYDATPALRFVLLNGQRLREGEVSREGLRVEQILPEGVLLNAGGNSFMLSIN